MLNGDFTQGEPANMDIHARLMTAHMMSEYLKSLSTMCKHYDWHKTGMHLFVASEELIRMLEADALEQARYEPARTTFVRKPKVQGMRKIMRKPATRA